MTKYPPHGDGRPKGPSRSERKDWMATMELEEIDFLMAEFTKIIRSDENYYSCVDNFRAARTWKSSQRRRYFKDRGEGCCGFYDTIVKRWNVHKMRFDYYLLGFNYGH